MQKIMLLFTYLKIFKYSIPQFKNQLNCYPKECLCSHNLNYMKENHFNSWKDHIINNNKWCPYNFDGSKKFLKT